MLLMVVCCSPRSSTGILSVIDLIAIEVKKAPAT
jgi:hypothetical protein